MSQTLCWGSCSSAVDLTSINFTLIASTRSNVKICRCFRRFEKRRRYCPDKIGAFAFSEEIRLIGSQAVQLWRNKLRWVCKIECVTSYESFQQRTWKFVLWGKCTNNMVSKERSTNGSRNQKTQRRHRTRNVWPISAANLPGLRMKAGAWSSLMKRWSHERQSPT